MAARAHDAVHLRSVERRGRLFHLALRAALLGVLASAEPTRRRFPRRDVHPIAALVVEHVGGDPRDEERHQDQRRRQHPLHEPLLPLEVHEVLDDQRRLHDCDAERRDQGDP